MTDNSGSGRGSTVTSAVVEAVADHAGVCPTDLPPLYEAVDPGALEALLSRPGPIRVRFSYAGYRVTVLVDGDRTVEVTEGEDDDGR